MPSIMKINGFEMYFILFSYLQSGWAFGYRYNWPRWCTSSQRFINVLSYQTHCLLFSVSDYSGPWFCTRDGLTTKLPFHFFSNVGLLIEIDFQYYVVHNVLKCFFIYHFHRATDQAGKLGVGKNNKIISIYSNYQVTFLKCSLSRKCCGIFFSWFYK
jgi:hypothetical protein